MSKTIVFATPFFLALIALELFWSRRRNSRTAGQTPYRLGDAISSLNLGMLSQLVGALTKVMTIGIYTLLFDALGHDGNKASWHAWYGWLLALLLYDLCYYWHHRAGHVVALFWAAHVVHHQSQHYNLTTALRQPGTGFLFGWLFYLPLALLGVPPVVFAGVAMMDLLYQFWVHTEQIGTLGWFDRWFCSPSNHRVHHAVNDEYIDKNYGGILMLWDHLFGTFVEERAPCVYGTRSPLGSCDPIWANLEVYSALWQQGRHAARWRDKLLVWFKPPGWQSADMARAQPRAPFRLDSLVLYDPPLKPVQQWFAVSQLVLILGLMLALGLASAELSWSQTAIACAAIATAIWATGRYVQGDLTALEVLALECAAATTAAACGVIGGYMVLKPLVMLVLMGFVVVRAKSTGDKTQFDARFSVLLIGALAFSLVGDVFLMLPGNTFIPGLASFLVAHLFYIGLLRQGQSWFANRPAMVIVLAVGAAMYAVIWPGLGDGVLKGAVAAYVGVIGLMVSQAIGRATELGSERARLVAVGAGIFMLSDALIAINKFVAPLPWASLWILASYYAAQMLIVHNARAPRA